MRAMRQSAGAPKRSGTTPQIETHERNKSGQQYVGRRHEKSYRRRGRRTNFICRLNKKYTNSSQM